MFKVGQRVRCVNGDSTANRGWQGHFEKRPETGKIYTIREIYADAGSVTLVEIVNVKMEYCFNKTETEVGELRFYAWRFITLFDEPEDEKFNYEELLSQFV